MVMLPPACRVAAAVVRHATHSLALHLRLTSTAVIACNQYHASGHCCAAEAAA